MKSRILYSILSLGILLTSCQFKKADQSSSVLESVANREKNISTKNKAGLVDTIEIERVALSFHEWYIQNLNNHRISSANLNILEGKNGKCTVDTLTYISELRNIGTISEEFIEQEKNRFHDCIKFLEQLDYNDYLNGEGYSFDEHCDFFYY